MNNDQIQLLTRIYDQLTAIKSDLEELADDTSCEAVEDAASDVDSALDNLEEILDTGSIRVVIKKDGTSMAFDMSENLGKLVELLRDDAEDEEDSRESDLATATILTLIRALNNTCSREKLDEILEDVINTLKG